MMIHVYARDESGLIEYRGLQEWDSVQQVVDHFLSSDRPAETERLLGWPTDSVVWYGSIGVKAE